MLMPPNVLNPFVNTYYFLSTVQYKKIFIDPKLKERILPEINKVLLDSLSGQSLK